MTALAFLDEDRLLSGDADGRLLLWLLGPDSPRLLSHLPGAVRWLVRSPAGDRVALVQGEDGYAREGLVRLLDAAAPERVLGEARVQSNEVAPAFLADGTLLLAGADWRATWRPGAPAPEPQEPGARGGPEPGPQAKLLQAMFRPPAPGHPQVFFILPLGGSRAGVVEMAGPSRTAVRVVEGDSNDWPVLETWAPDPVHRGRPWATSAAGAQVAVAVRRLGHEPERSAVALLDPETGAVRRLLPLEAGDEQLAALSFSGDGGALFAAGSRGTLFGWDLADGSAWSLPTPAPIQALACREELVATGHADSTIVLWPRGALAASAAAAPPGELPPGARRLGSLAWRHAEAVSALVPAGDLLISGSWDGTIVAWDPAGAAARRLRLPGGRRVEQLALAGDGRRLAVGSHDAIRVFELPTFELLVSLENPEARLPPGCGVAFEPAGKRLICGGAGGVLRLLDIATGQADALPLPADAAAAHVTASSLALSPDGALLAVGLEGIGTAVWLLELDGRRWRRQLPIGESRAVRVAFDPSGARVWVAADRLAAYDVRTGDRLPVRIRADAQEFDSLALSADGARIAAGYQDRRVAKVGAWDTETGALWLEERGHTDRVSAVAFAGQRLFSGSWDATIRVRPVPDRPAPIAVPPEQAERWAALEACGWLEAYPPGGRDELKRRTLRALADGESPRTALELVFDTERVYSDRAYTALLQELSDATFGVFRPTVIEERHAPDEGGVQLSFEAGGRRHECPLASMGDWVDLSFVDQVNEALAAGGSSLRFVAEDTGDQCARFVVADPAVVARAGEAGLL